MTMLRHAAHLFLSLHFVFLFGCSALREPLTCPHKGGPAWTEVRSEHFVLRTDLEASEAQATATRFEQMHAVLSSVLPGPRRASSGRLEIVLFERVTDFDVFAPPQANAYLEVQLTGDLEPIPVMVMQAQDLPDETRVSFLHELTHRFLHERFGLIPPWLDEGLAQYYAALRIDEARVMLGGPGSVDFSDRPYYWTSWRGTSTQLQVPIREAPTVWDLIHAGQPGFYRDKSQAEGPSRAPDKRTEFYGAAWKLVHLFMNGPDAGYTARFDSFLRALEGGARARDAFLETFGDTLPRLEQDFRRYLLQGRLAQRSAAVPAAPSRAEAEARPMSDADVHSLWARLIDWGEPESLARARRELDEAVASDPRSADARFRRALLTLLVDKRFDDADRELERALALRPAEPAYLYARIVSYELRAIVAGADDLMVPGELIEQLARTAKTGTQLMTAGWYTAPVGKSEEGLRRVERAVAMDPLCWSCERAHAKMLLNLGRPQEALAAVERAITLWPESLSIEDLLALRRRITDAMIRASAE